MPYKIYKNINPNDIYIDNDFLFTAIIIKHDKYNNNPFFISNPYIHGFDTYKIIIKADLDANDNTLIKLQNIMHQQQSMLITGNNNSFYRVLGLANKKYKVYMESMDYGDVGYNSSKFNIELIFNVVEELN